jgi:hypothetical protein
MTTNRKKRRLLVVAPYGIPLRDLVLNKAVYRYLFEESETDVLTPFSFDDPTKWGFANHIPLEVPTSFNKLKYFLASRALSTKYRSSYANFYTETNWESSLEALMLHHEIRSEPLFNPHRWKLATRFPLSILSGLLNMSTVFEQLPFKKLFRDTAYDAVITSQPVEGDSTLVSAAAMSTGIPVVCIVGGSDNLHVGGPVLTDFDLITTWGEEQEECWTDHQVKFRPSLSNTMVRRGGSLLHDQILDPSNEISKDTQVEGVPEGKLLVTFAAYVSSVYPNQTGVCQAILDTFDEHNIDGHLLVRVRPGYDDQMWEDFAAKNPTRVTVQIPEGVFFTKWDVRQPVDMRHEISERDAYIATLKRSALVVTAAFSTVFLDAFAAGTPAIPVGVNPTGTGTFVLPEAYRLYKNDVNSFKNLDFVTDLDDLKNKIHAVLTSAAAREKQMAEAADVYRIQAGELDGKAGNRVANAISEFLD